MTLKNIFFFLIPLTLLSCDEEESVKVPPQKEWTTEESINMQSTFVSEENDEIDSFLKHHKDWKVTKTGTGLRYFIYEKSESRDTAKVYDQVTLFFDVQLLDGTVCYSEREEPQTFMIEKTDIESGLHEALKHMCVGDKGLFILPSHLAHGLIGDLDKIPPLNTLIYDIHLIKIN